MSNAAHPAQSGPLVLETRQESVAHLVLNRPDKLNALSGELSTALNEALSRIAEEQSVRVVVLSGAGRAFFRRRSGRHRQGPRTKQDR